MPWRRSSRRSKSPPMTITSWCSKRASPYRWSRAKWCATSRPWPISLGATYKEQFVCPAFLTGARRVMSGHGRHSRWRSRAAHRGLQAETLHVGTQRPRERGIAPCTVKTFCLARGPKAMRYVPAEVARLLQFSSKKTPLHSRRQSSKLTRRKACQRTDRKTNIVLETATYLFTGMARIRAEGDRAAGIEKPAPSHRLRAVRPEQQKQYAGSLRMRAVWPKCRTHMEQEKWRQLK